MLRSRAPAERLRTTLEPTDADGRREPRRGCSGLSFSFDSHAHLPPDNLEVTSVDVTLVDLDVLGRRRPQRCAPSAPHRDLSRGTALGRRRCRHRRQLQPLRGRSASSTACTAPLSTARPARPPRARWPESAQYWGHDRSTADRLPDRPGRRAGNERPLSSGSATLEAGLRSRLLVARHPRRARPRCAAVPPPGTRPLSPRHSSADATSTRRPSRTPQSSPTIATS